MDTISSCIKQPVYKQYSMLEALLLKAAVSSETDQKLQQIKDIHVYADDIDADKLTIQLAFLKQQLAINGIINPHLPDVLGCITKSPNSIYQK